MKVIIAKVFQILCYWPFFLLLKTLVRYKINGQENLRGLEDSPIIFATNHASVVDGPIGAAAMPRNGLFPWKFFPIRFVVRDEFFVWWRYPGRALYLWLNACLRVYDNQVGLRPAIREPLEALKRGYKVWIFPEGKMTRDGKLQVAKNGAVFLHQKTGAPLVPVGIKGGFYFFSHRYIYCPGIKIRVVIGKPMFFEKLDPVKNGPSRTERKAFLQHGTECLMREIKNLIV